jgi:hypothetical protein
MECGQIGACRIEYFRKLTPAACGGFGVDEVERIGIEIAHQSSGDSRYGNMCKQRRIRGRALLSAQASSRD